MEQSKLSGQKLDRMAKTATCKHFMRGTCNESNCKFAHTDEELRTRPNYAKTRMCLGYVRGRCTDAGCTFAHGNKELRNPPKLPTDAAKGSGVRRRGAPTKAGQCQQSGRNPCSCPSCHAKFREAVLGYGRFVKQEEERERLEKENNRKKNNKAKKKVEHEKQPQEAANTAWQHDQAQAYDTRHGPDLASGSGQQQWIGEAGDPEVCDDQGGSEPNGGFDSYFVGAGASSVGPRTHNSAWPAPPIQNLPAPPGLSLPGADFEPMKVHVPSMPSVSPTQNILDITVQALTAVNAAHRQASVATEEATLAILRQASASLAAQQVLRGTDGQVVGPTAAQLQAEIMSLLERLRA